MILLPRQPLSRRALLRGFGRAGAVALALPFLEAFLDSRAWAACETGLPRRFGIYYWGNGNRPERWTPIGEGEGDAWALSEELAPLVNVKDRVCVVSGYAVRTPNVYPHNSGAIGLLTGATPTSENGSETVRRATIDQVIANAIGGDTVYRSLQTTSTGADGWSYNGPNSRNPPENSPFALYERIFGATFRAPGEEGVVDPSLGLRQSVLDLVAEDIARLQARVGAADRARLDQHLTGVRDIELRLARLQEDPPNLAACARPEPPLAEYPDIDGRPQLSARTRAMCDLLIMAMACDQTRVFGHYFNDPVRDTRFPGASAGHHDLTHNETGDQPEVHAITVQIMEEYAYLLERMAEVPEGDGSLLDNSIVLATSDVSLGQTHSLDEMPIVLAGGGCGALRTNLHTRSYSRDNVSHVMLSVVRAMGVELPTWGDEEGEVSEGLAEIET